MSRSAIDIVIEHAPWRAAGIVPELRDAARTALRAGRAQPGCIALRPADCGLTILLADDARLEALNTQFRGHRKPTNVLSFPATGESYLGDIAIAYTTTAREAQDCGKSFRGHALHLAVHGVLHLLGYDHETVRERRVMETLEKSILAEFGVADPYVVGGTVAAIAL
jgi:probable rRNA maturation factor